MKNASSAYPPPFSLRWLVEPRYWPVWLGLAVWRGASLLPAPWVKAPGAWLGALLYRTNHKRRRIAELNVALCFPDLSAAERATLVHRFFRVFGQAGLHYGTLWWASRRRLERLIRVEGEDEVMRRLAEGRRVILFTGHSVALDFGAIAASLRMPIAGPMKQARNPLVNWLIARGRTRFDCRVFPREAGIRAVIQEVRKGRVMYYLPDEDLGKTQKTLFAPFFGVPTATLTSLARLARACDADVLPCMTYFEELTGRYVLRIHPPIAGFPSFDEHQDATKMNAEIERMIRVQPEQYMWSMKLFRTRPAGEPNPYA